MKLSLPYAILYLCVLLLPSFITVQGQNTSLLTGQITDDKGLELFPASIKLYDYNLGATTNENGRYTLNVPPGNIKIQFSYLGYQNIDTLIKVPVNAQIQLNIVLTPTSETMQEVAVRGERIEAGNLERIDLSKLGNTPNTTGNIEDILKTFTGVSSNNELSAQYSVRGGNYDENLIYVNDIEIYRPFLIRSGQQEGLSFINPDLIGSLQFSAGVFNAEYGDKLSSVLDIKYRRPSEFEGRVHASLLGGGVSIGGNNKKQSFTHISGFRYKTSQYLLGSLETTGEYSPQFFDFQTYITYDLHPDVELSFLGNIASNKYEFVPQTRYTSFGSVQTVLGVKINYEGQEIDRFRNGLGALTLNYKPSDKLSVKLIGSYFQTNEEETYDILGYYQINQLDNAIGSDTQGDSIENIGQGATLRHARNYLKAGVYNTELRTTYYSDKNFSFKFGAKYQFEVIDDNVSQWEFLDSAFYSSPFDDEQVLLSNAVNQTHQLASDRYSCFAQYSYHFSNYQMFEGTISVGARASYWELNQQAFVSPRINIDFNPVHNDNIKFHLATGIYYQPPFYKELKKPNAELIRSLKAQKSIQYLAGFNYYVSITGRPFKFSTEAYYKDLVYITPYKVDNVRIQYLPEYEANGYTAGVDFKLNGEFLPGTESWASLSFMRSVEDIKGDYYINRDMQLIHPGYYPRPTNQHFNFSMLFQDYLPSNPEYKVNLMLHYGGSLTTSPPDYKFPSNTFDLPKYRRIDVGVSKTLKKRSGELLIPGFKQLWVSAEIFNLFAFQNTISYEWIKTVNNMEGINNTFAVPNHLTSRRINIKISGRF